MDLRGTSDEQAEEVLEVRPPKAWYGVASGIAAGLALASAAWGYLEYAGAARTPRLALSLSGACFGAALAILFGFRFAFPFQTLRAPRDWSPPNLETEPPIAEALGLDMPGARRSLLLLLGGALSSLLALLLLPLRSLGGWPRTGLRATAWRSGMRLVSPGGGAVRVQDLAPGASLPVLPELALDDGNSLAVLVRLRTGPADGEIAPAFDGVEVASIRAYSRICTHAGCTVSVFLDEAGELVCPCHWSRFDAARGGAVLSGPASQPLPELPLAIDPEGYLVAKGDFDRPVGPRLGCPHRRARKRAAG